MGVRKENSWELGVWSPSLGLPGLALNLDLLPDSPDTGEGALHLPCLLHGSPSALQLARLKGKHSMK